MYINYIPIWRIIKIYQKQYCLKMSLEMLRGVKDIFIYVTQTDISYHLQSH